MRTLKDDWGDGIEDGDGAPRTRKKKWITVTWQFPAGVTCTGFEVAIFTGTDPAATDAYLVPLQKALPSDRKLVVAVAPNATLSNVNAAVRALYA